MSHLTLTAAGGDLGATVSLSPEPDASPGPELPDDSGEPLTAPYTADHEKGRRNRELQL